MYVWPEYQESKITKTLTDDNPKLNSLRMLNKEHRKQWIYIRLDRCARLEWNRYLTCVRYFFWSSRRKLRIEKDLYSFTLAQRVLRYWDLISVSCRTLIYLIYFKHKLYLKARPAKKSLEDSKPATGLSWNPVTPVDQ